MATRNYKKAFIHYIEQYVDFISILQSANGTTFLDICGWDGGDIYDNGLEDDETVEFDKPETVDNYIKSVYDSIKPEFENLGEEFFVELPKISYEQFLKLK